VTGVLPVALEESTKTLQAILAGGKEYVCVMKLHGDVAADRLAEVFKEFVGEIFQRPPLRSSVKRRVRTRTVYYLQILEVEGRNLLFKIGCQSGTYVRKLVHDIGEALGIGSHMFELRRTKAGPFTQDTLVTLHELVDAVAYWREEKNEEALRRVIQPGERAVELLPKVVVKDSAVDALCHGAGLALPGIVKLSSEIKEGDLVAVLTLKGELVALGRTLMPAQSILEGEKGIAVKTERVVMVVGTYPKAWRGKTDLTPA